MSQNNRPNLTGWAAIITSIAALITAIGLPDSFWERLLNNPSGNLQQEYIDLRKLLTHKKYKEADEKTNEILLQITGNNSYNDNFNAELIGCTVYQTIDALWREYSDNKFGFSVQMRIYQEVGNNDKFGDLVDWRENGKWLNYTDLNKTLEEAPPGYFPSRYRGPKSSSKSLVGSWMAWSFLSHPNRTTAHCLNSPSA